MPGVVAPPHPRRRLRVSLRGLMILVLVSGGGIGYLSWKVGKVRAQRAALARLKGAGVVVLRDYERAGATGPPVPGWLRRWAGDDYLSAVARVELRGPATPDLLEAIGRLDDLTALVLRDTRRAGDAWPTLLGLTGLEEATLAEPGVTDRAAATLGRLGALRSVRLDRTAVTDAGIVALAPLADLRELAVDRSPGVTDAGMARLLAGGLPRLERFTWRHAPGPAPRTVRALAEHHPHLVALALTQMPVADADLAPIGALVDLTTLDLSETRVGGLGVARLGPLGKLETLLIGTPGVDDAGMAAVGRLRRLRVLNLGFSRVTDAGLSELAALTDLVDLRLRRAAITDASAPVLARFEHLETLLLNQTRVTDATLDRLGDLTRLRLLGLGRTAVTPDRAARFRAAAPGLAAPIPPPHFPVSPSPAPAARSSTVPPQRTGR